ncbi:MAG: VOC family protein [Devosiaceae bacterium]|nr:VOC family protein [Devosiaceae bacterium]
MKFRYTILYVSNVVQSLNFFEKAFGFTTKMLHESSEYGEMDTGSTILAFASRKSMQELGKSASIPDPKKPAFEIALETDNVAAGVEKAITAGAKLQREPEKMPWGQTIAYVSDPNGFLIEICTPI